MADTNTNTKAPSDATQQALTGAFIAIQSANKAIKLQGTMPKVDIDGLKDINTSLAAAQGHADLWAESISGNVQNQLQAIIDYNSLYVPLSTDINSAISEIKRATKAAPPSDDTMSNLASMLAALQDQVQVNLYGSGGTTDNPSQASAVGVFNQLVKYQKDVASDSSIFKGYATLAFNSESGIDAQIKQYNDDIDTDNEAMAKDRAMIGGGAAMIVTGVLICVVAVALAPETGGATIAVIGTIGVAATVGGAVMIGVSAHDLNSKEADVSDKIVKIANDQAEKVSLVTVNSTCSNISTYSGLIYGALDTIKTSWEQMDNDMANVIGALNMPQNELMKWIAKKAGTSAPTYPVMGAILEAQFAAPQADWAKAATTAQTLLNGIANVVEFILPVGTIPTQAAIAEHAGMAI